MIKLLVWDRSGFVIYYKRLEKGTFEIPDAAGSSAQIEWSQLVMILEGIQLKGIRRRLRYVDKRISERTLQTENSPQEIGV